MWSRFFNAAGRTIAVALFLSSCATGLPQLSLEQQILPPPYSAVWEQSDRAGLKTLSYTGIKDPVSLYALALDLTSPGLKFVFTQPSISDNREMDSLKTSLFAEQYNLTAAINAAPYAISRRLSYVLNKRHAPCYISGLYIYDGYEISSPVFNFDALYLLDNGSWKIDSQENIPVGTQWAVGGFHIFLMDEINLGNDNKRYPRTAIGFSGDMKTMYLLVVDGQQKDCAGMTTKELGYWMLWLGASSGINMDGGGSSTLVLREQGRLLMLNSPVHRAKPGLERAVASHLGFRLPEQTE